MVRVYVGVSIGALLGIMAFLMSWSHNHGPEVELIFIVTVVPPAVLGAVIGGFHATMEQLRALRRQRALQMEEKPDREPPEDEPPTGIREF
jgi:hypothetical protein